MLKDIFFICCVILWMPVAAQHFSFRQYQVESGLSNNLVRCSVQDTKGFLWFGTTDGLNRFDGYSFKVFRTDRNNAQSIGQNPIRSLCADSGGRLWVGTDRGLYHYNPEKESFTRIVTDTSGIVRDIKLDNQGWLWFILAYQLYRLHIKTGKLVVYPPKKYFKATALCFTGNQLWVASSEGGLEKYHPATDTFTEYDLFKTTPAADKNKWLDQLHPTSDGNVLVGTATHGAKIFLAGEERFQDMITLNEDKTAIFAKAFAEVGQEYWIGTESAGIYVYNKHTGAIKHILKKYNDPYALSDNSINSFCIDTEGGIWVGTNYGGVNYYSERYDVFKKYFPLSGDNSLSGNVVREIHGDDRGNLWIGTEDAGLNKLELSTGRFLNFTPDGSGSSISYKNIFGMLVDGDDLWIGTYVHGLDIMDIRTGKVKRHYPVGTDSNSLHSDFVNHIWRTSTGRVLLATARGAYIYNRDRSNFSLVRGLPVVWYSCIFEDKQGIIWAGTPENGIKAVNIQTGETIEYIHDVKLPTTIADGRVNSIISDSRGGIWVATAGGLCRFNSNTNDFTRYTTENGLPSDVIFSILEDNKRQLWLSTSHGLVCFNPQNGRCKTYKKDNGLLSDQFNFNSAYKDREGKLYFGSLRGLVCFNPADLNKKSFDPPLYITGMQVYGNELLIDKAKSPLEQSITWTGNITLDYDQSSFSFDFAALHYTSPEATEYAYKMEGLDTGWTYLKTNRKVFFTNLSPGNYQFKVKASLSNNEWMGAERSLHIHILPPWWLSVPAYLIYAFLVIATLVLLIRGYSIRAQNRNRRKMEQLEILKTKEMYEEKLHFFTNVAHEIKTPLTLIKGPMEKVIKFVGRDPEIADSLKLMDKNTNRLVELTNQFLDFRQAEIAGFSLNFVKSNISELLQETYEGFKPLAVNRGLNYTISLPKEPVFAWIDVDAFNKITSNLFSNAVKYAENSVSIHFTGVDEETALFVIEFSNDGFLIPEEMGERIFEPFVRLKETKKQGGTGIGLALALTLARLHNGSLELKYKQNGRNTFCLKLPTQQNNLK